MNYQNRGVTARRTQFRTDPRTNFSQLDDSVLVNLSEASAILAISPHTLKMWRRQGYGPQAVKLGRSLRFAVNDLRSWLSDRRKAS